MSYYTTALQAEFIKKKRTGTFWICIIMGLFIPLSYFISQAVTDSTPSIPGIPYNIYQDTLTELGTAFGQFFFPLIIIITAVKITSIDHKNGGWQLMETQPLSKWSIYTAKLSLLLIANLVAIATFLISTLLVTWGLTFIHPPADELITTLPIGYFAQLGFRLFVAGLFLSALLLVMALLFKNYIAPVLIGFLALLGTLILNTMNIVKMWNPFTVLSQTTDYPDGSDIGHFLLYTEWASLIGFLLIGLIGYLFYTHKTLKRSFTKPKNALKIGGIALVGVVAMGFILHPNTNKAYDHTVISGTIESDRDFKQVFLIDEFTQDTLATIPIKDNHFHQRLTGEIPLMNYYISFAGDLSLNMKAILGQNDSLYIQIKSYNGASTIASLTGTRMAENQYARNSHSTAYITFLINRNKNLSRPKWMAEEIYSNWQEATQEAGQYRTKDNYAPRTDFKKRIKKILTAKYLNNWHTYLDKVTVVNPDILAHIPDEILSMKDRLSLHDESLMGSPEYLDYVMYELTKSDTSDTDFLTKSLNAVNKIEDSNFKDRLLFSVLKNALKNTVDAGERQHLIARYGHQIKDPDLRALALSYYNTIDRLAIGSPAPNFKAVNLAGESVALSDFRGKLVVVDVWATWCGPCLREAPYFERVAIKHKDNDQIVFIALSTDEHKQDWYLQAKNNSPSVLQWHLPKHLQDAFSKAYALNSIPRYLFIDEEGNFINSDLAFPSRQHFEITINRALKERAQQNKKVTSKSTPES